MIKLFRKSRKETLSAYTFGKYLSYAIGEIILVVIGILIALFINNSREEILQKKYIASVFEQIREDLVNDSIELDVVIKEIASTNRYIIDIIENKVPDSFYNTIRNQKSYDHESVKQVRSLCTDFVAFLPNTKGYDLLKSINSRELVNDSLTNNIMSYYSQLKTVLPEYNKVLVEISKQNIHEYKKYAWFENWAMGKYDPQFIDYLRLDEENKKRIAEFYTYSSVSESYWKTLKKSTKNLIILIDNRVGFPEHE